MTRVRRSAVYTLVILLVLVSAGLFWWNRRQDPNNVFWDMISNNLSTPGVTHVVEQTGQGLSITQSTQVNFTQHPSAHALTVIKQGKNTLVTEELSNIDSDYVRYKQIDANGIKKLDTSSVVGKWAKLGIGQSVAGGQLSSELLDQSLLDIIPIGNLTADQRRTIIASMHTQNLFQYNKQDVRKEVVRGRENYLYAVTVKQDAYIRVMQQFEDMIGAANYATLKPVDYKKAAGISIVIAVDARSHLLSQLYQTASGRVQRYEGFGVGQNLTMPKASITTKQLTERLGALQ